MARFPDPYADELRVRARALAESFDSEELAGQLIMTSVDGRGILPSWGRSFLEDIKPGALVLFGYNIPEDPLDLVPFLADIRAAAAVRGVPPFLGLDHEGGEVFRFRAGVTRLPSARDIGLSGGRAASVAGRVAGSELFALGLSLNMAPVAEALGDANRAFLGSRAWSKYPAVAGTLALEFLAACQEEGVAGTAKHFPGNSDSDPHEVSPVLDVTLGELEERYLKSFRIVLHAYPAAMMLSHAVVPALDPTLPVTVSPRAIELLKDTLGFAGIVLTDDLVMGAMGGSGGVGSAAIKAIAAGADMLMVSGAREALAVRDAIAAGLIDGSMARERIVDAVYRILLQKLRFGLDETSHGNLDATEFAALVERNRTALAAAMSKGWAP